MNLLRSFVYAPKPEETAATTPPAEESISQQRKLPLNTLPTTDQLYTIPQNPNLIIRKGNGYHSVHLQSFFSLKLKRELRTFHVLFKLNNWKHLCSDQEQSPYYYQDHFYPTFELLSLTVSGPFQTDWKLKILLGQERSQKLRFEVKLKKAPFHNLDEERNYNGYIGRATVKILNTDADVKAEKSQILRIFDFGDFAGPYAFGSDKDSNYDWKAEKSYQTERCNLSDEDAKNVLFVIQVEEPGMVKESETYEFGPHDYRRRELRKIGFAEKLGKLKDLAQVGSFGNNV